jgi:hypothetical protein
MLLIEKEIKILKSLGSNFNSPCCHPVTPSSQHTAAVKRKGKSGQSGKPGLDQKPQTHPELFRNLLQDGIRLTQVSVIILFLLSVYSVVQFGIYRTVDWCNVRLDRLY